MLYKLPKFADYYEYRQVATNPDQVGLEIEIEFVNDFAMRDFMESRFKHWTVEGDGSLRCGLELKTKLNSNYQTALTEISKVFQEKAANIQLSERCSVHVHLNFQQNTVADLVNFTCTYTCLEEHLDRISGARKQNLYCLGIEHAYFDHREVLSRIASAAMGGSTEIPERRELKYACVNYQRIFDLGTVEIRTHEGTIDGERIRNWVDILLCLKEAGEGKKISDHIEFLAGKPTPVCEQIFGAHFGRIWFREAEDLFRKGYYRVMGLLDTSTQSETYKRRMSSMVKKRRLAKRAGIEEPEVTERQQQWYKTLCGVLSEVTDGRRTVGWFRDYMPDDNYNWQLSGDHTDDLYSTLSNWLDDIRLGRLVPASELEVNHVRDLADGVNSDYVTAAIQALVVFVAQEQEAADRAEHQEEDDFELEDEEDE